MAVKVMVSNAFKQGRVRGLSSNQSIEENIAKGQHQHLSFKHIAQIAQAEANVKKNNKHQHNFWETLAKKARAMGKHLGDGYSLKYIAVSKQKRLRE